MMNLVFIFAFSLIAASQEPDLKTGDLVFLDLDCGDLCNSIAAVTHQQFGKGPSLSHVGAIDRESGVLKVIEAWPIGGVRETSWSEFSSRVKDPNKILIQRMTSEWRESAKIAVRNMRKFLGRPYDQIFTAGVNQFYCSELIFEGWKDIPNSPFHLRPMYFGARESADYRIWSEYYSGLGMEPPAGWPGVSPLGIYLDAQKMTRY